MNEFHAPVDEIVDALLTAGLDGVLSLPAYSAIDIAAVRDVVAGFAELASGVIAPTDRIGDEQGATFDPATGRVTVPAEIAHAYARYVEGGWQALGAPEHLGGGGFPKAVATATHEMFGSANLALSLNPMLTQSAVELLERWGDDWQQRVVLTRLVDGTWTGTMNLTEPDAGSDLGAVRTTATPIDDRHWRINGTKIYITWGEHELTENIIHLVLARTPGAPAGTKGISLFLVPRSRIDDEGRILERNGVHCRSIEHKMGIHASPTCVLEFVDAVGELVGPIGGGMNAMFSMMNPARLAVGVQGVSVAERSLQQAVAYAAERRQGRAVGSSAEGSSPIIEHPDVRRMLLDVAVAVDAMRLLTYATSVAGDLAAAHPDDETRAAAQRRADLLTPLAKSWPTDVGIRAASTAVQVHGGMGFIEETGIAQRYRDIRIAAIYEGTNGIQALDLIGRKIGRDSGAAAAELFADIDRTVARLAEESDLADLGAHLAAAVADCRTAVEWVVATSPVDIRSVQAGAVAVQELLSLTVAADLLCRHVLRTSDGARRTVRRARAHHFVDEFLGRRLSPSSIARLGEYLDAGLGGSGAEQGVVAADVDVRGPGALTGANA